MNKIVYFISAILFSSSIFAQKDGFWDKERATSKEIVLTAGKRALIKTEELPSGTTEFVFRITLLNEGQKLTSSLVSVLKAIPDPTGISQGAAGAIHLTSAISGDDKCTYAIFNESKTNGGKTVLRFVGFTPRRYEFSGRVVDVLLFTKSVMRCAGATKKPPPASNAFRSTDSCSR